MIPEIPLQITAGIEDIWASLYPWFSAGQELCGSDG